jgi:alkylated DNA repair dioxygenase AlkB
LREELITPGEEAALLEVLARIQLGAYVMHGTAARRRVAYFGVGYGDVEQLHVRSPALPDELLPLRARCAELAGVAPEALAQVLVTRYPPGAGIGWHRDMPAFGIVVGVSLAKPCRFRLRRMGASARGALTLTLRPRSGYVLAGAVRWRWQHFIPPVEAERWSVTFRTLREDGGLADPG